FIQYLDSDDALHPGKLAIQVKCMRDHPRAGYVFSEMAHFTNAPAWQSDPETSSQIVPREQLYLSHRVLTLVGLQTRHASFAAGPWAEDLVVGDDLDYFLRLLMACDEVLHVKGICVPAGSMQDFD